MKFSRFILFGFLFISILLFTSCLSVYFDQQQPKNGIVQHTIPEEMQGRWGDSTGTLVISDDCMITFKLKADSLGNLVASDTTQMCLSDSINIQKANEYYIVNLLDSDANWSICAIKVFDDGTINWYYPATPPFFGKGCGLKVRKVTYTSKIESENRKKTPFFKKCLKPDEDKWEINEVSYTGQFRIKDIEKIIIPENVFWSLNPDGTINTPN